MYVLNFTFSLLWHTYNNWNFSAKSRWKADYKQIIRWHLKSLKDWKVNYYSYKCINYEGLKVNNLLLYTNINYDNMYINIMWRKITFLCYFSYMILIFWTRYLIRSIFVTFWTQYYIFSLTDVVRVTCIMHTTGQFTFHNVTLPWNDFSDINTVK